jgi:hypothetical protein
MSPAPGGEGPTVGFRAYQGDQMSQWLYFIHAPREHFGATMTEEEQAVWGEHMQLLQRRLDEAR